MSVSKEFLKTIPVVPSGKGKQAVPKKVAANKAAAKVVDLKPLHNVPPEEIKAEVEKVLNTKTPTAPFEVNLKTEPVVRANAKLAALTAAAAAGVLPTVPDLSKPTHKAFRKRLAAIVAMVEAKDIAGLKADTLEPKSSSRALVCRYRDAAIKALEAQAK